jgi:D-methionine transport system ATP-binding protein
LEGEKMIRIKGVNKYFGNTQVLKNINVEINKGEIFGLVGHSGAGKSTLLRCINGLESYDDGSITVNNKEIKDLTSKELREFRKDLGMIFQHFSLLERLNVYENVALPLEC